MTEVGLMTFGVVALGLAVCFLVVLLYREQRRCDELQDVAEAAWKEIKRLRRVEDEYHSRER